MSRKLNWLISASLAIGTVGFVVPGFVNAADDNANSSTPSQNNQNVADQKAGTVAERTTGKTELKLPDGAQQSEKAQNSTKFAGPVTSAVNKALDKNGLDSMVSNFVDQDRDRLKDIDKINADDINAKVDAITKAYKEKYNQKFDMDDRDFSAAQAVEGEIKDPATFAQNWPLPLVSGAMEGQTAAAKVGDNNPSANTEQTKSGVDKDTAKNGNIEKDRNVAILRLPAENGMPAMDISEIRELTGWKIDVPNNRTAQQIHDDVSKHLDMVTDSSKWNSDPLQARRDIARHVLMGVYGVEEMPKAQAQ